MTNTKERDEWRTPQDLFDKLHKQYEFTLDCCANRLNSKCLQWSSSFVNEITGIIPHIYWMNPPFSKSYEMFKHFFEVMDKGNNRGVAIFRCDNMETKVWQELIIPNASWILIPNKRICYEGLSNKSNRPVFASALIGYNVEIPENIEGRILVNKPK